MGENERIAKLEDDVKDIKAIIHGEGMEDGMKTTIAKTDQKVDQLCSKMDGIQRIGMWLIGLMATGVLGMIWEAAKRVPR